MLQDEIATPESLCVNAKADVQAEVELLGVEWDRWEKGTHNGTVAGVEYFKPRRVLIFDEAIEALRRTHCLNADVDRLSQLSSDPIVAFMENYKLSTCSFVRESEVEVGISMADAISEKYLTDEAFENSECQPSSNVDGKKLIGHEFVGRSKAVEFFSQTKNLLMLGLQECRIDRLGDISGFSFPRVRHLYLSNNLIHELSVVSGAISYLPNLETLCVSGNFFTAKCDTFLEAPKLTTVVMNKTLIGFDDVVRMLSKLSNLKSLSLCGNAYSDIGCAPKLRSLQTLDLSDNSLWNWYSVLCCIKSIPTLKSLVLSNNKLCNICVHTKSEQSYSLYRCAVEVAGEEDKALEAFAGLNELYIDNNSIYEWATMANMAVVFRNLKVLRFKLSITNRDLSPAIMSLHRQVLIAIFPELKVLNGSDVTVNERINAERYYLTLASANGNIFSCTNHPEGLQRSHRERLELIHGNRDDSGQSKLTAQNLASRMIRVVLVPDGDSESYTKDQIARQLPSTTSVRDVKSLCSRLFSLELSDIVLVYNDGKMPLCESMDEEDAEIQHYGISDGYNIRVQSRSHRF